MFCLACPLCSATTRRQTASVVAAAAVFRFSGLEPQCNGARRLRSLGVRVASFRFFVNLFADIELSPSSVGFLTGCSQTNT